MSKQVLSIEQMQHLKELGVDTNEASATVYEISETETYCGYKRRITTTDGYLDNYIDKEPTFTLQDVLDLLPKELIDKDDYKFVLKAEYGILHEVWYIGYYYYDVVFNDTALRSGENLLDAAYEMLCWCAKNGYIETNKSNKHGTTQTIRRQGCELPHGRGSEGAFINRKKRRLHME